MAPTTAQQDADDAARLADISPGDAGAVARSAARRAHRERDSAAAATAERALGHALLCCGDLDGSLRHLRRSVACGRKAGSAGLIGEARMKLAYAMTQLGRPRAALREIDAALTMLDGPLGARARAQRASILHEIGRLDEALAEFQSALAGLRRADDLLGVQRILVNRSLVQIELHALTAAKAGLFEAQRLAERLGRQLALGIIAEDLGVVEGRLGDIPAALAQLDRAERLIPAHGGRLGPIHRDRAELLLSVGLVAEARTAAEQAVVVYRQQRRMIKVPEVRLLLAQASYLDRDWAAALRQARTAMREFARQERADWVDLARLEVLRAQLAGGGSPRLSVGALKAFVDRLTATGWPEAALEARLVAAQVAGPVAGRPPATSVLDLARAGVRRGYLVEAGRAARRGPAVLRARGWYARALLRRDGGDARGAAAAARAGLRILDEHSAAMGAADLRAHSAIHRAELAELGLRTALGSGRPAQVLEWAERGRASQLLHRAARPPEDPELARMLSELRAAAGELDRLPSAAGARPLVQRQVELERRIRDHTRQRRGPGGASGVPVTPGRLAEALKDWALVEFVQLDGVLHGLSLAGGRLRLRRLGAAEEMAELVERLPFALHRLSRRTTTGTGTGIGTGATRSAALALLRAAASRLDAALLRPFSTELDDRPLVVVPTGPLHSVPWSILPSCAGRPLAVSPSATLWHDTTTRRHVPASTRVAVAAGPRLLGARDEARAVARIHDTTALTGAAATADAVLAALGSAEVVHLAAHGRLSPDNPLFSDLLLADGPLVVHDLEQLPRVPHTVVLAACDSGRSAVRAGDELLGLSATFIARGAAQLVASVLPIPDAQTAPLMIAFHERLARGEAPAVALAAAQHQLGGEAGGAGDGDSAALAAAAGFVCLGAGSLTPPACL